MDDVCETCGNEMDIGSAICPFCGTRQSGGGIKRPKSFHRIINIEYGRPTVEQALAKLARELERAKNDEISVITVIHGYGASGKGGRIRAECRKMLDFYKEHNTIRSYIAGELFSKKTGVTRALLRRLPLLLQNDNLNKKNKGVSIIEM